MERSKTVDSLKGIAILGVLAVHFTLFFSFGTLDKAAYHGARGVQLFFVINGFLTAKSLANNKDPLMKWYLNKFVRLLPLYWIYGALFVIFVAPKGSITISNIIANFLCLHVFIPKFCNTINISWFIGDIVLWYLLAPIITKLFSSIKKMSLFTGLYLILYGIFSYFINYISMEDSFSSYFGTYWFLAQFPVILVGVLVYYIYELIETNNRIDRSVCNFVMVIPLFVTMSLILPIFINVSIFNGLFTWGVCLGTILLCQLCNPWKVISNAVFTFIGKYSYGMYLAHILVLNIIHRCGIVADGTNVIKSILIYTLATIITFVVAYISEEIMKQVISRMKSR